MPIFRFAASGIAMSCMLVLAQEKVSEPATPVQMTITVEPRHDKEVPALNREDVMVFQKSERLRVTNLAPCRGENAALELFVLMDDASAWTLGGQLNDLRRFIESQPAVHRDV